MVLTHDVGQRDNLRVGRFDGVVAVVEKLKGHPLFAHVTLTCPTLAARPGDEPLEDGTSKRHYEGSTFHTSVTLVVQCLKCPICQTFTAALARQFRHCEAR